MKCRAVRHLIWVFTVCQSTHLGVSRIQRVKATMIFFTLLNNLWHVFIVRTFFHFKIDPMLLGFKNAFLDHFYRWTQPLNDNTLRLKFILLITQICLWWIGYTCICYSIFNAKIWHNFKLACMRITKSYRPACPSTQSDQCLCYSRYFNLLHKKF